MLWGICELKDIRTETTLLAQNVKGYLDSKVHGANMAPIWGRHFGPKNVAIWESMTWVSDIEILIRIT